MKVGKFNRALYFGKKDFDGLLENEDSGLVMALGGGRNFVQFRQLNLLTLNNE